MQAAAQTYYFAPPKHLLSRLAAMKAFYRGKRFYYGLFRAGVAIGDSGGTVAWGSTGTDPGEGTDKPYAGHVTAHKIGHLLGRNHPRLAANCYSTSGGDLAFPYDGGFIGPPTVASLASAAASPSSGCHGVSTRATPAAAPTRLRRSSLRDSSLSLKTPPRGGGRPAVLRQPRQLPPTRACPHRARRLHSRWGVPPGAQGSRLRADRRNRLRGGAQRPREELFKELLKKEKITEDRVELLKSWEHSGFRVHADRRSARTGRVSRRRGDRS